MKVLRKLRCLQIEVGVVQSLCRNDCHQVILLGQVLELLSRLWLYPIHDVIRYYSNTLS